MSNTPGIVGARPAQPNEPNAIRTIEVTRFSGGAKDGFCTQVTIGSNYIQLNASGVLDLINLLGHSIHWEGK